MQITDAENKRLHQVLPIDEKEKILAIYKHHWFAYVSLYAVGITLALTIMAVSIFIVTLGNSNPSFAQFKAPILAGGTLLAVLIMASTLVPVWLKSQDRLVLTEEALVQILHPTIFAAKTSQVGLQHVNDVTVKRDFFGSMCGFGHLAIETPGEQDNYEFSTVARPEATAREIISAHENYTSALESGRMPTTLGIMQQMQQPQIDPAQYQQFLQYQQMVKQQQADNTTSQQSSDDDQSND